jgi:hypothetical protein
MLWLRLEYQVWDQLDPDEDFEARDSELEADSGSGDLNPRESLLKNDIRNTLTLYCFQRQAVFCLIGNQKVL